MTHGLTRFFATMAIRFSTIVTLSNYAHSASQTDPPPLLFLFLFSVGDSSSKKAVVRTESAHEESSGFHFLEVNSTVHISRSMLLLVFIVATLAGAGLYLCHHQDKKEEKALQQS